MPGPQETVLFRRPTGLLQSNRLPRGAELFTCFALKPTAPPVSFDVSCFA